MSESKGKPTPQSNYIVTNELNKMSTMIRFVRGHARCTDNKTLDMLDETIELIEMTEGRRERRDDKPFSFFFEKSIKDLGVYINEMTPEVDKLYSAAFKEMMAAVQDRLKKEANAA